MATRRYDNAAQIEAAIDATRNKALEMLFRAESLETTVSLLKKVEGLSEAARVRSDEAATLRKQASALINTRLPKLGAKLGAIRTVAMPGIIDGTEPVKV